MRNLYFYVAVFMISFMIGLGAVFFQPASDSMQLEGQAAAGPVEELNLCGEMGYELNLSGEMGYEVRKINKTIAIFTYFIYPATDSVPELSRFLFRV